jgi:hypothetical protein
MHRALKKPTAEGELALTERDALWLRAIHRFRFLTTDQAQLLSEGHVSKERRPLNRRLEKLWAHDYLDRPRVQLKAYAYADKRHLVHALGPMGAKWLEATDGVTFPKGKGWHSVNRSLSSPDRLVHKIGVVDTVIAFDRATAQRADLRIVHEQELLVLNDWPKKLKPHRLPTRLSVQGRLTDRGTDPDYTLEIVKHTDGKERFGLCFLEWDNSSENFIKADEMASSIAQKHFAYADAYKRKLQTKLYGRNNFRVLFVVNGSLDRVHRMQEIYRSTVGGHIAPGVFLYTTDADLRTHGAFGDIWCNGDGEPALLA